MKNAFNIPPSMTLGGIESRINEIFQTAQICGWTSTELNTHLVERITEPLARRTAGGRRCHSIWFEGFAAGIIAARRSIIWREQVEFCYLVHGALYSTWKNTARRKTQEFYDRGEGHILNNAEGRHYWIGTDKVF